MPQMNGVELMRHFRNTPETKETIIIASADPHQNNPDKIALIDSNAYIAKPIQIDDLLTLLQHHLDFDWLYQSSPNNRQTKQTATYQLPSRSELNILYELALQGDVIAIRQRASTLMETDEALQPFALKLQQLAEKFQVNEICDWLASYTQ